MTTKIYSVKSNARRDAKKFGIDPIACVIPCEGGWQIIQIPAGDPVTPPEDAPGHTDLMVSPETIDAFVEANPPEEPAASTPDDWLADAGIKAAPEATEAPTVDEAPETADILAKPSRKPHAAKKPAPADAEPAAPRAPSKIVELQAMLVEWTPIETITARLGWLPHTARARISILAASSGLMSERRRIEGVTSYRLVKP